MKMTGQPIVSFCIPTYNRIDMLEELVRNILSSPNPHIEIIVMDDYSNDGTVETLQAIDDSRLHVYAHNRKTSPFLNWYDALNKASGDWIFHVNDRDWIDAAQIDLLIQTLQELELQNVGFAVAGEKISDTQTVEIHNEGYETLSEFALRFSHPTGQIFRREDWDSIPDKEQYFNDEVYGDYPHGYLYAILGNRKKGAYLLFDICDKAHYRERVQRTISAVYKDRSNKKEWFLPESRYQLLIYAVENLHLIENPAHIKPFVLNSYWRFFSSVTLEWYNNCHNEILKKRYNRPDLETNYLSLLANGFDYINLFREYLANHTFYWADDDFYNRLCELDRQLINWLLSWTNELRRNSPENVYT